VKPTNLPSPAPRYTWIESDTKCADWRRSFKVAFTTVEACANECLDHVSDPAWKQCKYFSTNADWCIGCSGRPDVQSAGFESYQTDAVSAMPTTNPNAPTTAPTEPYTMISIDTKCAITPVFENDFTTIQDCYNNCLSHRTCLYFSTFMNQDENTICMGCSEEPTTYHKGAVSYLLKPDPSSCDSEDQDAQKIMCLSRVVNYYQIEGVCPN